MLDTRIEPPPTSVLSAARISLVFVLFIAGANAWLVASHVAPVSTFEIGSIWFLPVASCAVILAAPRRRDLLVTVALLVLTMIDLTGLVLYDVMLGLVNYGLVSGKIVR